MICSIEVPVIRGGWLMQCIDSVLQQTSPNWQISLLWDQGDALSAHLLDQVERAGHPRIRVHYAAERLGIARARQFLTDQSHGELIVPLDDDDLLKPEGVAHFLKFAADRPWAGIIRARRTFIDDQGQPVFMQDWFPFERRTYDRGATLDTTNHSQPYAIRRSRLLAAGGWTGFEDFEYAGEDCSTFMKIEESSEIELLDEELYAYRIHGSRTSLRYDRSDANEMWRRIADQTTARRELEVQRVNDQPPFVYQATAVSAAVTVDAVEFVVPFIESNEKELELAATRVSVQTELVRIGVDTHFVHWFSPALEELSRIEVALTGTGPILGTIALAFFSDRRSFSPALELEQRIEYADAFDFDSCSLTAVKGGNLKGPFARLEVHFTPAPLAGSSDLFLHALGERQAMLRLFSFSPAFGRLQLDRCLDSIAKTGASPSSVHVIEESQSSAANRNEAFRATHKPWICFLDDDAELATPATLPLMLERAREWQAGLCGPKLLTASGHLYSGLPYTDPIALDARVAGMGEVDTGEYDITTLVPWLPSTVLLTHRSVMLATGGFDESYLGSQHEDVDFALRARSRGFSCLYVGEASAIHHNALRNASYRHNKHYLTTRWRDRPELFLWTGART